MKIVIDIPDEVAKENTPKAYFDYFGAWSSNLTKAFENTVVLPKGHGDLIDRNALKGELWWVTDCPHIKLDKHAIDIWEEINTANAVIPADK